MFNYDIIHTIQFFIYIPHSAQIYMCLLLYELVQATTIKIICLHYYHITLIGIMQHVPVLVVDFAFLQQLLRL